MTVQGQRQLGFLQTGDDEYGGGSYGGGGGGGFDWFDLYMFEYGWDGFGFDGGGGDGGSWWDNFDPITGDYRNPSDGGSWWDNFDPITGDYRNPSDYETIAKIETREPAQLPSGPSSNWWDFLEPYLPRVTGGNPIDYDDIPPAPGGSQPKLPGYCPGGTYHPRWDPFACVPYPPSDSRSKKQPQNQQSRNQPSQQQKKQQQPCPKGQVRNPNTGKCVAIPQCPPPTRFNPKTGKCEKPNADDAESSCGWLCWLLIIGAGVVVMKAVTDKPKKGGRK